MKKYTQNQKYAHVHAKKRQRAQILSAVFVLFCKTAEFDQAKPICAREEVLAFPDVIADVPVKIGGAHLWRLTAADKAARKGGACRKAGEKLGAWICPTIQRGAAHQDAPRCDAGDQPMLVKGHIRFMLCIG